MTEPMTITTAHGANLIPGDVVTFARHDPWWLRTLIWARIVKRKPLKQFVVSWTNGKTAGLESE